MAKQNPLFDSRQAPLPYLSIARSHHIGAAFCLVSALSGAWMVAFYLWTGQTRQSLDDIRKSGVLEAVAVEMPARLERRDGEWRGIEHEIAARFAAELGLRLAVRTVAGPGKVLDALRNNEAHLALNGASLKRAADLGLPVSRATRRVRLQVAYQRERLRPRAVQHLRGRPLAVVAGGAEVEYLRGLRDEYPWLQWTEAALTHEQLLREVHEGAAALAVAGDDVIAVNRLHYPKVQVAFTLSDLGERLPLGFALASRSDPELARLLDRFIGRLRSSGEMDRIADVYLGPAEAVDVYDTQTFHNRVTSLLPHYRNWFLQFAQVNGLDWRLLASVSYQESHWDPEAKSRTGVRGIMQITESTAKSYGLQTKNLHDPAPSIRVGAKFLADLIARQPADVQPPDRLWFALASYNIGFGHVMDARQLARADGADPSRWSDLRRYLPLKQQRKWYKKTPRGYARGREAVTFVNRVRKYYEILSFMEGG